MDRNHAASCVGVVENIAARLPSAAAAGMSTVEVEQCSNWQRSAAVAVFESACLIHFFARTLVMCT